MATVTKENIGLLHEKLTVKLEKTDYLPAFDKALKDYSKKANIPGFRKGMVPAGLIKKMYGTSLFTDEVMRTLDRELMQYLQNEKLDIFAQPLPLDMNISQLDMNAPAEYIFSFEVGMKPEFSLPDLSKAPVTRYVVDVTDDMVQNEVERLQNRHGNMVDKEVVENDENVVNVLFTEADASGNAVEAGIKKDNSLLVKYFAEATRPQLTGKKTGDSITVQLKSAFDEKEREWIVGDLGLKDVTGAEERYFNVSITKVGLLEKRELNEEFFTQLYPTAEIKTEADFRNKLREEIGNYWKSQAANQIHDQIFHFLTDHSQMNFPEAFLRNWVKTQGETVKTDEEVEAEFPGFLNQLKWTLVSDKIVVEAGVQVNPDEIRDFAKQQLFSYMGGANLSDDQPWVTDYVERMMKDRKYVEESFSRIQTQKMFEWAATQVKPTDKSISAEDFTAMVSEHQHHHHS